MQVNRGRPVISYMRNKDRLTGEKMRGVESGYHKLQ